MLQKHLGLAPSSSANRSLSSIRGTGDWEPDTVVQVRVNQSTGRATVYAWTIPAQVAGRWTLTTPEGRRVALQLRQRFQRFTGPGE
jgi:hypothetical protein